MDAETTPSLFGRNFSFLARFYPAEARRIEKLVSELRSGRRRMSFRLERCGTSYLCRSSDAGSQRWIHGPDPPADGAARTLAALPLADVDYLIVWRAGLGYLVSLAFQKTDKRVSIIEPDEELFTLSLDTTDWTHVLGSPRCLLILGPDAPQRFFHLTTLCPQLLKNRWILTSGIESTQDVLDEVQLLNANLHALRNKNESNVGATAGTPRELDILLHGPPTTAAFSSCFMEAAAEIGLRTIWRSSDDARFRFLCNPSDWTSFLEDHRPSLLLGLNRGTLPPPAEKAVVQEKIPQVLYFLEDADWYDPNREDWQVFERIYVFDPTHGRTIEELGLQNRRVLPLGALLRPPRYFPPWMGDRRYPISFVGSSGLNRESGRYFQQIERMRPGVRATCKPLIQGCLEHGATWLRERLSQEEQLAGLGSPGLQLKMIEEEATIRSRLRFLEVLGGLPLTLFGDAGWGTGEHARSLSGCYAGRAVRYPGETAAVYARSDININLFHLQCEHSLSPRVYDVMACGGFLLSQYSPAFEEMFRIGEHLDTFADPSELLEKVHYYLARPNERREIAQRGQAEVLARHTATHRLRRVLQDLGIG